MAEDVKASTGAKSQFFLNDGSQLYQLKEVKSISAPNFSVEEIETTHLESDAKEFAPGDVDFGEFEVVMNYRPGSDTDTKIEEAVAAQAERAFKINVAVRGVLTRTLAGNAIVVGYDRGEITRGGVMEATLRLRATGYVTSAAYSAS